MRRIEIPLSDPDISAAELEAVNAVLLSPRLSQGPVVEQFEQASWSRRRTQWRWRAARSACAHAGLPHRCRAQVVSVFWRRSVTPWRWRARPGVADIDYWSGTLAR